jgi:hypothetical protein
MRFRIISSIVIALNTGMAAAMAYVNQQHVELPVYIAIGSVFVAAALASVATAMPSWSDAPAVSKATREATLEKASLSH